MDKKKILIVDDEEQFALGVQANLKTKEKYEVKVLFNAKDIIEEIHSFKPDIILLDLIMPKVGGIEVCEMLNNDEIGSRVPIIIVSALEKNTDKLAAYKLGVVAYLTKPIETSKLIESIEKFLDYKK